MDCKKEKNNENQIEHIRGKMGAKTKTPNVSNSLGVRVFLWVCRHVVCLTNIEFIIQHLKRVCIIYLHPHLFCLSLFFCLFAIAFSILRFIRWILIQHSGYNITTINKTKIIFPFINFHVFIVCIVFSFLQCISSFLSVPFHDSKYYKMLVLYENQEIR